MKIVIPLAAGLLFISPLAIGHTLSTSQKKVHFVLRARPGQYTGIAHFFLNRKHFDHQYTACIASASDVIYGTFKHDKSNFMHADKKCSIHILRNSLYDASAEQMCIYASVSNEYPTRVLMEDFRKYGTRPENSLYSLTTVSIHSERQGVLYDVYIDQESPVLSDIKALERVHKISEVPMSRSGLHAIMNFQHAACTAIKPVPTVKDLKEEGVSVPSNRSLQGRMRSNR